MLIANAATQQKHDVILTQLSLIIYNCGEELTLPCQMNIMGLSKWGVEDDVLPVNGQCNFDVIAGPSFRPMELSRPCRKLRGRTSRTTTIPIAFPRRHK